MNCLHTKLVQTRHCFRLTNNLQKSVITINLCGLQLTRVWGVTHRQINPRYTWNHHSESVLNSKKIKTYLTYAYKRKQIALFLPLFLIHKITCHPIYMHNKLHANMYKKAFYRPLVVVITASSRVINDATTYSTSPLQLQLYFLRFSPSKSITSSNDDSLETTWFMLIKSTDTNLHHGRTQVSFLWCRKVHRSLLVRFFL